MATLLRDLIAIPERTGADDYVLRLSENVGDRANAALDAYVVTEQLAAAFDQALGLVGRALATGESKGAFLEGSFGSGKSHFMAVLHAILRGEPAARDKEGLREVVTAHDGDLAGRHILPLAFHLLGAESFEERVLGSYVEQIMALHPDAELPRVHQTDALLDDADALRTRLGDTEFFAGLGNRGTAPAAPSTPTAPSKWGRMPTSTWDVASYDTARHAPHGDSARASLVKAVVDAYYSSFTRTADYVDLDTGLAEISRHAKSLGYDAVVLFLDELILWLAYGVHEPKFFRREVQKLTKLVEGGGGRRQIPLVSFIAKQLDLRAWLAESGGSGAQQSALAEGLSFQKGRFPEIVLGDANLPYVAHQRLLRPKDAAAAAQIQSAFAGIDRSPGVWRVLLDNENTSDTERGSDEAAFKLTYPFSPVLVSTLRKLAGAMQRERTALKVMQQLLVDRRDTLTVDDLIPVGDAYDYLVRGDALDAAVNALFSSARDLWADKLQPFIITDVGTTVADVEAGRAPEKYYVDERLAKTLLLSAIAPKVPALQGLTPERLAHLNHGSIVSLIPGGEGATVLAKVRRWAEIAPEIHLEGPASSPTITVQLTDVDHQSIVRKAANEDTEGRRRQLVQELVADELGVDPQAPGLDGSLTRTILWRGTHREVDVVFGNVRDVTWLSDSAFEARPGTWRFVVDHPFDEAGHTSEEDRRRVEAFVGREVDQRTVVWLPRFFTQTRRDDLGKLVVLNYLLAKGERWQQYADHLSEQDRLTAKTILEGQRSTLDRALRDALQQAYGAAPPKTGTLEDDPGHDRELIALTRTVNVQRPVGASLGDSFGRLIDQVWDATYPEHPRFDLDGNAVRPRDLALVMRHVERAMNDPEKRVGIEGDARTLRRVGNPLGVGHTTDTAFVFGDAHLTPWATHLDKALAQRGDEDGPVRAAEAREWVHALGRGLTEPVVDLVILAWAALRQRVWYDAAGRAVTVRPEPGQLQAGMEMRSQEMPTLDEWKRAGENAGYLFGENISPFLTPAAVADLADKVRAQVHDHREPVQELVGAVRTGLRRLEVSDAQIDGAGRMTTAVTVNAALDALDRLQGVALIRALSDLDLAGRGRAMGKSLKSAESVTATLTGVDWSWYSSPLEAKKGEGGRARAAAALLTRLTDRLAADEESHAAARALADADRDVREWLVSTPVGPPDPVATPPVAPEPPSDEAPDRSGRPSGARSGTRTGRGAEATRDLEAFVRANPDVQIEVTWRVIQ